MTKKFHGSIPNVIHTDTPDTITTKERDEMIKALNAKLKEERAEVVRRNREKIAESKRKLIRLV